MTWLTPLLAAGAAAIAIPSLLILYFLKLRRRDVEVSTTLLWKKAIEDLQANAPFQKLRRNILLFLQLLILAAALLALAQPQFEGMVLAGGRHVIVIDNSASMATVDELDARGRPISRLEKARQLALDLVDSLDEPTALARGMGRGRADEAMVVVFNSAAEPVQPFTSDKAALRAAINAVRQTHAPAALKPAAELVNAHAPAQFHEEETPEGEVLRFDRPQGRIGTIHVYSDGIMPDQREAMFGPEDTIGYIVVGRPDTANVGITDLRAARDYEDPDQLSVFVGLSSTDRDPRTVDVELLIDGVVAEIRTARLPAAELAAQEAPRPDAPAVQQWQPAAGGMVFRMRRPQGGLVTVRLRAPDGSAPDVMSVDDTAWLVIPPAQRLSVAVFTPGNPPLADVLSSLPLARLESFSPGRFEEMARTGQIGEFDVIILDRFVPETASEQDPLPPGRFLVLGAVPPVEGVSDVGQAEGWGQMMDWSREHPVLRGITLDNLFMYQPRMVEVSDRSPARVLGRLASGTSVSAAILELATAHSRAVIVPFDVIESNWGFHVSWVVFIGAAVRHLGEDADSGVARMVRPGQTLEDRLPPGSTNVQLVPGAGTGGGGRTPLTPSPDGRIVYGPIYDSGVYAVSWRGQARAGDEREGSENRRFYTVNLVDPNESNVGATDVLDTGGQRVVADAPGQTRSRSRRNIWPWLVLAALAISMIEWFIYNRKVHV
jgi:hypothetical protein